VTRRLLCTVVLLTWGLWLGGMVMLFAALPTIFRTPGFGREVQGAFAGRLFPVFERMQLVFAAVALLATAAWWIAGRARLKLALFALFALGTITAVFETTRITPRIEVMVADGRRGTPEFNRMHQLSTRVYMAGAVVLLIAGLVLPSAIRGDATTIKESPLPPPQTSEETAPA
jgi:hypothetical protein